MLLYSRFPISLTFGFAVGLQDVLINARVQLLCDIILIQRKIRNQGNFPRAHTVVLFVYFTNI